jgi:hypothetical protein
VQIDPHRIAVVKEIIDLAGGISLTRNLVDFVRTVHKGAPATPEITDPIASITFVPPESPNTMGRWDVVIVPRRYTPPETLFTIGDLQLALATVVQSQLRGKVLDFVNGKIRIRRKGS